MKSTIALCAALVAAAAVAGGPVAADDRCPPAGAAAGLCAPLHFVDDDSTQDLLRRRAYELGYRDALSRRQQVAPPPDIALDGKEGYSQSYGVHRQYLDRNGNGMRATGTMTARTITNAGSAGTMPARSSTSLRILRGIAN